jgi:hypothetical protein
MIPPTDPDLLANSNGAQIERAQPPHESKLDHVGIHEQELHAAAAYASCNRLHGRVASRGIGRQKHVLQRTELCCIVSIVISTLAPSRPTKKNALAMKVYPNTVQPTHPPVPLPPFEIAAMAMVTITPTNL